MNRRNFLQLAGLTALAAVYKPNAPDDNFTLAIPDTATKYTYSHSHDGFLNIDIEFDQREYNPKDMVKDIGSLNPGETQIDAYTFKRGELQYTGGRAVKCQGYWETTYSFQYRPGGHNPMVFSPLTGRPGTIEILPYADTVNLIEKGIEDVDI